MLQDALPDKGNSPVILDCYAVEVIGPGDDWKIFLKAEDGDGDMSQIAAVLWQAGVGTYPTDLTRLRGDDRRAFCGYLLLPTPIDQTLLSDQMELTLLVRDGQENRSEPINLPLRFNLGVRQEVLEKWVEAEKHRLGTIMINIESSHRYNLR